MPKDLTCPANIYIKQEKYMLILHLTNFGGGGKRKEVPARRYGSEEK